MCTTKGATAADIKKKMTILLHKIRYHGVSVSAIKLVMRTSALEVLKAMDRFVEQR
jgi:hypothetical protein